MSKKMKTKSIDVQYFKDLKELEIKHFDLDSSPYEEAQKFHDNYEFILNQYLLYKFYDFKNIDSESKIDNLFVIAYLVTSSTVNLINLSA